MRQPKMLQLRSVPLPMPESDFSNLRPSDPPLQTPAIQSCNLPSPDTVTTGESILAWNVHANLIFPQVDDANAKAVAGHIGGNELMETFEKVMTRLDAWAAALPCRLVYSPENFAYWKEMGLGNTFAILHVNYHYLNVLAFYQFLHGSTNSPQSQTTTKYAHKCRESATEICNIIHRAAESSGTELLNSIIGHVLTVASTVQLHILLFSSNDDEIRNAHNLLERNFDRLLDLKKYWSCVDISFYRFDAFHRACLRSRDDSHFRLDQYMLKFMVEFAAPMTERPSVGDSDQNWEESWAQIAKDVC